MRFSSQRQDLAAALRLAEHFDFHEGICNHFSLQVSDPGDPDELYLINPYGLHWSEIEAESLILMDGDGTTLEGEGTAEATARNIHIAGHRANPRHACLLHTHMPYATALTMLEDGRLEMAHQTACRYWGRITYEAEFGGLAHDKDEGERLATEARSNEVADVVFLANHGVVVGGPSVAHAFDDLYYLERACRQQVLAQSTGKPLKIIPHEIVEHTASQYRGEFDASAPLHFEALKRKIGMA
ncbi:MAG: aldolase [Pseudomonadota bacterium]